MGRLKHVKRDSLKWQGAGTTALIDCPACSLCFAASATPAEQCRTQQWGWHQLCQRLPGMHLTYSCQEALAVLCKQSPAVQMAAPAVKVCSPDVG